jgi:hypothetical protein
MYYFFDQFWILLHTCCITVGITPFQDPRNRNHCRHRFSTYMKESPLSYTLQKLLRTSKKFFFGKHRARASLQNTFADITATPSITATLADIAVTPGITASFAGIAATPGPFR